MIVLEDFKVTKEILDLVFNGRIIEFTEKDNNIEILQVRSGEPHIINITVEDLFKKYQNKQHKG